MNSFFASGHAVDFVLAVLAAEAVLLIARGRPPVKILLMLSPGAAMLIALRGALTGTGWPWIAFWLTVSLPLHLADLRHRRLI